MKTQRLTRPALLGLLTFLGGLIRLPLGPVPITLQSLFVLLAGLTLAPREALLAMSLNLALSFLISGAALFLSPSLGFLLAFIPAAWLLAWLTQRGGESLKVQGLHTGIASLLIYLLGLTYLVIHLGLITGQSLDPGAILVWGFLVFLPGDLVKAGLALVVAKKIRGRPLGDGPA
ncbi:MAG: biotin transporter BioY [Clostridiaceae bacterium]|nr:biotin transporter BioY [Clostridiaceae bacterium]